MNIAFHLSTDMTDILFKPVFLTTALLCKWFTLFRCYCQVRQRYSWALAHATLTKVFFSGDFTLLCEKTCCVLCMARIPFYNVRRSELLSPRIYGGCLSLDAVSKNCPTMSPCHFISIWRLSFTTILWVRDLLHLDIKYNTQLNNCIQISLIHYWQLIVKE